MGRFDEQSVPVVGRFDAFSVPADGKKLRQDEMRAAMRSIATDAMRAEEEKLIGAGRGLVDVKEGIQQAGGRIGETLAALVTGVDLEDTATDEFTRKAQAERKLYEDRLGDSRAANLGRVVSQGIAMLPIPGGRSASHLKRAGSASASGAGVGALQFVPEGGSRAENAAVGAGAAGATSAIMSGLQAAARRIVNAGKGVFSTPDASEVVAAGQREGVPVFTDDISQNAAVKKIGTLADEFGPLGTAGARLKQNAALEQAAKRQADRIKGADISDDFFDEIQAGMKNRLSELKAAAKVRYDNAARELDPKGTVNVSGFKKALFESIRKESQKGSRANPELIRKLQSYLEAPEGNFSAIRTLRSDLGDEIADFYTGRNAAIGAKGVHLFQKAKEALDEDIAAFAGKQGSKRWREADEFYKKNLVPFKRTQLKNLVDSPEPEKAWRFLLANKSLKSRAELLYNALDERGRQAVKYGLAKDALDRATREGRPFSPATYAKFLEDHANASNTFFTGADKAQIDGLAKLMRHLERSGAVAENPPTGQRVILPLLIGGSFLTPKLAAGAAGGALGVKLLYQTATGRNLLMGASKATPGTAQMDKIIAQMASFLTRASAAQATAAEGPDTQPAQ